MVAILVILDGASEPVRDGPTSLERAQTPLLDRLAREGTLQRVQTVAPGLEPGSESAIPSLLGWVPTTAVDRGALEAAAAGVVLRPGERAWRVDALTPSGQRAPSAATRLVARGIAARIPDYRVRPLHGHRFLVTGPPPLPPDVTSASGIRVWPEGIVPPRLLDSRTVVIAARGAAAGIARLMGADVRVPLGATGRADTDLRAKASLAVRALAGSARRVVVHVGGADEAAHELDGAAKVDLLSRVDSELLSPLVAMAEQLGATLHVCPDHGCDPVTGLHDALPVPAVSWQPGYPAPGGSRRMTERAVADRPSVGPEWALGLELAS